MIWYENDIELLEFLKFLVDAGIINTEKKLKHYSKNPVDYTEAYNIYVNEVRGRISDIANKIMNEQ